MRNTLLSPSSTIMEHRPIQKFNLRNQQPNESPLVNRIHKKRFVEEPKSQEKIVEEQVKRSLNRSLSGRELEKQYITNRKDLLEASPLRTSRKMYKEAELAQTRDTNNQKKDEIRRQALESIQSKSISLVEQDNNLLRKKAIEDPHLPQTLPQRFLRESDQQIQSPRHKGGIKTFTTQSSIRLG